MTAEERRSIQRIVTTQEGQKGFWLMTGGSRIRLLDVSMAGFAVASEDGAALAEEFSFRILRDEDPREIAGTALIANRIGAREGQIGCVILTLDGPGRECLHAWLVDHVIACAAVPISAEEADCIVEGPSIV